VSNGIECDTRAFCWDRFEKPPAPGTLVKIVKVRATRRLSASASPDSPDGHRRAGRAVIVAGALLLTLEGVQLCDTTEP
jgi:hypothetical protein